MKNTLPIFLIFLVACGLSGCDRPLEVSGRTFLEQLCNSGNKQNSFWRAEFLAVKDGRAYLRYWSAAPSTSSGGTKVHYTPLEELPSDFSAGNPMNSCHRQADTPDHA